MEDCFSNIYVFGAGYERAKGYSRVDFDAPEKPMISEVIYKRTRIMLQMLPMAFSEQVHEEQRSIHQQIANLQKKQQFLQKSEHFTECSQLTRCLSE